MADPQCDFAPSSNKVKGTKRKLEAGPDPLCVRKKAVVVLTRLSNCEVIDLQLSSGDKNSSWSDVSELKKNCTNGKQRKSETQPERQSFNNKIPMIVSTAFSVCATETRKIRPNLPEEEVQVGLTVLARKKHMRWHLGKIVEILIKENECQRYKVHFKEKGKIILSGHHIAFETLAKPEQLYVGARVVVKCQDNEALFQPAIVAELPTKKNRLRFLVFTDDGVPEYVGLPSLHLVCRPREDSLDDLQDSPHKSFMTHYLRDWPYPRLIEYQPGESINVVLKGVMQKCLVKEVDCSLFLVIFKDNQKKEWIYRGSTRIEHLAKVFNMQLSLSK